MKMKYFLICATILAFLAFPLAGIAGEKGPGAMPGMRAGETGPGAMPGMKMEEHGKMGDKIFGGKIGP